MRRSPCRSRILDDRLVRAHVHGSNRLGLLAIPACAGKQSHVWQMPNDCKPNYPAYGPHLPGIAMESMDLCQRYLAAINSSSLAHVLALFESENAPALSPAHGLMPASAYFPELSGNSETSIVRIRHVFESLARRPSIALHYHYTRIGTCGQVTELTVSTFSNSARAGRNSGN